MQFDLISPCGGKIIDLIVPTEQKKELLGYSKTLPSIQLSQRAVCDLELLATGAFSPLDRFMAQADYKRVLNEMRLSNNHIFPIPITLSVEDVSSLSLDQVVTLRNAQMDVLAVMQIEEIYEWNHAELTQKVLGTRDSRHPLVAETARQGKFNLSGKLQVLNLPTHRDFQKIRLTPEETRKELQSFGNPNVVAFQTRNPLHRAHEEMLKRALEITGGTLLLHPSVGTTKIGDVDYLTRVRTYKAFEQYFSLENRFLLALLPLAMRLAGPREAVWHALIRRNFGANHFIVGRDHASPGVDSSGKPFYQSDAAQKLAAQFSDELKVKILSFDEFVYLPHEARYEELSRVSPRAQTKSLSGTEVREKFLDQGKPLPAWFTHPKISQILSESYVPRYKQGVCLWFTGLSGAGKTTIAEILVSLLLEAGRKITLLDGDVVRTNLSKGLGFSREDRDTNVRRIGFVAAEVVRHGGIAICAAVSPYRATRDDVRNLIGNENFIEIFVDTPLAVCEQRDTKGMYAKARQGLIKNFTGIDDPYEPPTNPEITINTQEYSPDKSSAYVLSYLTSKGFLQDATLLK